MLRSIIFDFDGVLFESVEVKTVAFRKMFESYGEEIMQAVVEHHLCNGGMSRFEKLKYYHQEILKQHVTQEVLDRRAREFAGLVIEGVVAAPWVSGAEPALQTYYKKMPLFICSGTPEDELNLIIRRKRVYKYFEGVFGSPASKETILQGILSRWSFLPDQVVFVGDSLTDYRAAESVGVRFVGRGPKTFAGLDVVTMDDLTELPRTIDRIAGLPV